MQTNNNSAVMEAADSNSKSEMQRGPSEQDLTPKERRAREALHDLENAVNAAIGLLQLFERSNAIWSQEIVVKTGDRGSAGAAMICGDVVDNLNDACDAVCECCLRGGAQQ